MSLPPVAKTPPGEPSSEDRMWALLAHLSMFVFGIFGPLIIWLVKKDTSPFVDHQAKEALNFQLSVLIAEIVLAITCIGPFIVIVAAWVFAIIAAMESNKGVYYEYPYTIRMIT